MIQKYIVELNKEDIDDLVLILDFFLKSQGLSSAERCVQLHKLFLSAKPLEVNPDSIPPLKSVEPDISLEEIEDELGKITELSKKGKSSKTIKKKK